MTILAITEAHTYDGSIARPIALIVAILLFVGGAELVKRTDWYHEALAAEDRRARARRRGGRGDRHSPPPRGRRWWGGSDGSDEDEEARDLDDDLDEEDQEDADDLAEEDRDPRFHRYRPTSRPGPTYRRRGGDLPDDLDEDEEEPEEPAHWSAPTRIRNPDGTITEIPWEVEWRRNQRGASPAENMTESDEVDEDKETAEQFVARLLGCNTGYNEIVRQVVAAGYCGATNAKALIRQVRADLEERQN